MNYVKKSWNLLNNYVIARLLNQPSTAQFWYLPEPSNLKSAHDLASYQTHQSPPYLIDYQPKLTYTLENQDGIIVLPYDNQIGRQVNPEAAFQYTLGIHDRFLKTQHPDDAKKFWHYVNYFQTTQTHDGLWPYQFNWYGSKAPWYSALAQSRGASVMLRAWLLSHNQCYLDAAKNALAKFTVPTKDGGFLHQFSKTPCTYFEEYPHTPSAVINGFMASLFGLWELQYYTRENWLTELWTGGITSLHAMLPYYSNGWWSLYDLDEKSPLLNVNSPRYHLLEINYLQILTLLSNSETLKQEHDKRIKQYAKLQSRLKALLLKSLRKILYK